MQLKRNAIASLLFAGLLGASLTSQAALFDDTEARKKILQVEEKSLANDSEHQAAIAELQRNQADIEQRLANIENMLQNGGLVDLQNEIDALKQEVAQLRGDLEVANHNLQNTQQRQKDLYTDTDTRLRRIESGAVSAATNPQAPATGDANEMEELNQIGTANAHFENAEYKQSFEAYDTFLRTYPKSQYAGDATYGLGYSQYALKNYKSAIATQQKLLAAQPDHPKAADAMYNIANSQIQLGDIKSAKNRLRALIKQYPTATVTPNAKKRLKAIEAL